MTAVCVMVVVDNCINLWTEPSLSVCMYGHFSLTVALYLALVFPPLPAVTEQWSCFCSFS